MQAACLCVTAPICDLMACDAMRDQIQINTVVSQLAIDDEIREALITARWWKKHLSVKMLESIEGAKPQC